MNSYGTNQFYVHIFICTMLIMHQRISIVHVQSTCNNFQKNKLRCRKARSEFGKTEKHPLQRPEIPWKISSNQFEVENLEANTIWL